MDANNKRTMLNLVELVREQQVVISEMFLAQRCVIHALGGYDPALQRRIEAALDVARSARNGENDVLLKRIDELEFQVKYHE